MCEGFQFIGIDQDPKYVDIARQRMAWWEEHGDCALERVLPKTTESKDMGILDLLG